MQKKDLELVARTIASLDRAYRGRVAVAFAEKLGASNPRFDSERWFKACAATP